MSKELILSIKSQLPVVETGLDEDTKAIAGAGTGANRRISIKGGVFRKIVGGKEVAVNEDRYMEVIFVKMAHYPARSYYAQGYKEGERASPACWSTDGKTPDEDVRTPASSSCSACPHSVKGSGTMGKGTSCRLSWRVAVVLPNDPAGDVMQLILPPTSCFGEEDNGRWPFKPYIQMLASNNISAGRVVTRMSFDTKSPVPRLLFQPMSAVSDKHRDAIVNQSKTPAAEHAIRMNVYQSDEPSAVEAVLEPQLQGVKAEEAPADTSELLKRWGNKGKK